MRITQGTYKAALTASSRGVSKAFADPKIAELCRQARALNPGDPDLSKRWSMDHPLVKAAGRALMKAGLTTATGFNFFDLRGPAYFIFPLNTPFIQMIPKQGRVNAGVGTAAHWKATRNPNTTNVYAGVKEGQRNAIATPDEVDYLATYKEMGMEGGETFTAQYAGEGFTDNLADEHFRNLARLRLQEEMMTLLGNSGTATGNLGFALGQPPTPTRALVAGTGALGSAANVVVAVVAITAMGMNPGGQGGYAAPPTVAGGLTPSYTRTNADGTLVNVSCGISQISNVAAILTTNATAQVVQASIVAQKGAVGYAWFWGVNVAAALANVTLGAITSWPAVNIAAVAGGTQLGNFANSGGPTSFSSDNSFQGTDFDGLLTYAFNNGLWTDMNGGSFGSAGNGLVNEIENDLAYLWNNYQAQPDAIWCSSDVRRSLDQAIAFSATGTNSYIFQYSRADQGQLLGGFLVAAYKSKYSINPEGGTAIPIRLHPMLPAGTMYYDINSNPYPHSRIPAVRTFLAQRDYYSVEWPVVSRQWTFGTYIHQVLAHYMPWVSALRTGIGPFVSPCWIAAVVFGEDFNTGVRVNLVRNYLLAWERRSVVGKLVVGLYRMHGEAVAEVAQKNRVVKRFFTGIFNRVLRKAQAAG